MGFSMVFIFILKTYNYRDAENKKRLPSASQQHWQTGCRRIILPLGGFAVIQAGQSNYLIYVESFKYQALFCYARFYEIKNLERIS
jgi:hypothetical protein